MDEEDEEIGIPEWVVTFGDMMSLLLTFFIMLVSLSEIKQEEKFQALVESMRKRFGYDSSTASLSPGNRKARNSNVEKLAAAGRSKRLDTMRGGDKVKATVGENPRVESLRDTDYVTVQNVIYFPYASAELSPEAKERLLHVMGEFRGKALKIEVRGHTSMRPLPEDSPFHDDWMLAFARAENTMDFLVEQGVDRRRIVLAVAGENEPLHLEDPALIERNDRVELAMINEPWQARVGTEEEQKRMFNE